jgi:hypothetical protein
MLVTMALNEQLLYDRLLKFGDEFRVGVVVYLLEDERLISSDIS